MQLGSTFGGKEEERGIKALSLHTLLLAKHRFSECGYLVKSRFILLLTEVVFGGFCSGMSGSLSSADDASKSRGRERCCVCIYRY